MQPDRPAPPCPPPLLGQSAGAYGICGGLWRDPAAGIGLAHVLNSLPPGDENDRIRDEALAILAAMAEVAGQRQAGAAVTAATAARRPGPADRTAKGQTLADAARPILAVLIDADNTPARLAPAIFDEIARWGEAAVRRVYGDFTSSQISGWSRVQAEHGLVPHHAPAHTIGKNSSDISLVIDAMDLLHAGRFDGFVLVSSDSDFTRLASRIREQGLEVIGIGQQKTPESFRKTCKRFIFLENLSGPVQPDAAATEGKAAAPAAAPAATKSLRPLAEAKALLLATLDAASDADEWVHLGVLGQQITAGNPEFDPRSYGHKKLSDLVRAIKVLETRDGAANQLMVRRRD